MEIRYAKAAAKYLESLDRDTKRRILAGIMGLTQKPPVGDIKTLQEYSDGRLRLRVGKYRVIYRYDRDGAIEILHVLDIDSRGGIYKRKGKR